MRGRCGGVILMALLVLGGVHVWADAVTSFTLINADSNLPVPGFDPLSDGATLNFATLPTPNLNIRANTSPSTVGSVRFGLDANPNYRTESVAPYALEGDTSGDYNPWTPSLGPHTVTATPYTESGGGGTAGTPLTVNFDVIDESGGPQAPTADAGPDVFMTLPDSSATLHGSGDDPDGTIVTYAWTKQSGPSGTMSGADTPTLLLTDLVEGIYVFRLTVTDDDDQTGYDEAAVLVGTVLGGEGQVSGELRKWHRVTVTFDYELSSGPPPQISESSSPNPFYDYRLIVTFTKGARSCVVPGYYAADGDAGETSATSGNKWRVHFTPDEEGVWDYEASFRAGTGVAISDDPASGMAIAFDGAGGSFTVGPTDKTGRDHRAKGMLRYVGGHYLQFAETGEYFLKGGADSPENFLAYADFDGTYDLEGTFLHAYGPHVGDWQSGDPTWQGTKGKGIIGAINYLSSRGGNSVYFLTYNIDGGDGMDTWPWSGPSERYRFDCSKLDQWEVVFSHMAARGVQLHVVTQENENDHALDGGNLGPTRKLYYRELIARFAHNPALVWNLGEENTNSDAQRMAFADYIRGLDPYDHPIKFHTWYNAADTMYDGVLGHGSFEAASIQGDAHRYNEWPQSLRTRTAAAGRPWAIYGDEQGPPVDVGLANLDQLRKEALWGNLMGGGAGVEWYFGYQGDFGDLQSESWRVVESLWEDTAHALVFFQEHLPFWEMQPNNSLAPWGSGVFATAKTGEIYAAYLPEGGTTTLLLAEEGDYTVAWYDPRNGGDLQTGSVTYVSGPGTVSLGDPPATATKDWAVLVWSTPTQPVRPQEGTLIFQDGREYPDHSVYGGTRDAHVMEDRPYYNSGGNEELEACRAFGTNASSDRCMLIEFADMDVSSEGGKYLGRATLTLQYIAMRNAVGPATKALFAHKLLHDWGEGTKSGINGSAAGEGEATWRRPFGESAENNPYWWGAIDAQYSDPSALDGVWLGGSEDFGPVGFDVTEAVRDHLSQPSGNFGFVIREEPGAESADDGSRQFASREHWLHAWRPSLEMTFDPPAQTPPGFYEPGWNLTSVPVEPVDADAGAVFADLAALGNTIDNNLYRYDPGAGYRICPSHFTEVARGAGYWLFLSFADAGTVVSVSGGSAAGDVVLPLSQGWQMVGCPQRSAGLWANCLLTDGVDTKGVQQAGADGWIEPTAYYYEPGSGYGTVRPDGSGNDDSLRPWHGYWLLAHEPGLQLIVPLP